MSTLPHFASMNEYVADIKGKAQYCYGISQLEAGTKYYLSTETHIDEIVVIGSEETIHECDNQLSCLLKDEILSQETLKMVETGGVQKNDECVYNAWTERNMSKKTAVKVAKQTILFEKDISSFGFYKHRIAEFLLGVDHERDYYFSEQVWDESHNPMRALDSNQNVKVLFQPLVVNGVDNLQGIVDAIKGTGEYDEGIEIYMDVQGGSRTDAYVRNAVLAILAKDQNEEIKVKKIIATDFQPGSRRPHPIINETSRYRITDLIAGMNAFLRYGKADIIKDYWNTQKSNDRSVTDLINTMQKIDEALSLCNVVSLQNQIKGLSELLSEEKDESAGTDADAIFTILKDGIRNDYGNILSGKDVDASELVKWARRKGLFQQAVTIIESLIPSEIVRKGILYYCTTDSQVDAVRIFFMQEREKLNRKEKYKLSNVDHYFLKDLAFDRIRADNSIKSEDKRSVQAGTMARSCYMDAPDTRYIGIRTYTDCAQNQNGENAITELLRSYYECSFIRNKINHADDGTPPTLKTVRNRIDKFIKAFDTAVDTLPGKKEHRSRSIPVRL